MMVVAAVAAVSVLCVAEVPRDAALPAIQAPPCLDGRLDDECWGDAATLSDFVVFRRGPVGSTTGDTDVLLAHDHEWLYIGLTCDNPNMQHVESQGTGHDDGANYKDDSVEILLGRQGGGPLFCYILTCDNRKGERRIAADVDIGWNTPWASATVRTDRGWTAEAAIPLLILNANGAQDLGINFIRNKIAVTLDQMGAKQSERKVMSCWKRVEDTARSSWPPFRPWRLSGSQGIRGHEPFLPRLNKAVLKGYETVGNELKQVYTIDLENCTGKAGAAVLNVLGARRPGTPLLETTIPLPGSSKQTIQLAIPPAADAGALSVALRDGTNKPFQTLPLQGEATLIADLFTERSYYTTEPAVTAKAVFNLSAAFLASCRVRIRDGDGNTLTTVPAPGRETVFSIPLGAAADGDRLWRVSLAGADEREYEVRDLPVIVRRPQPGRETKIDRFRRVLLYNGAPYFMFGMLYRPRLYDIIDSPEAERTYRLLADTGFNLVVNSYHSIPDRATDRLEREMALAGKYNLQVLDRFCNHRAASGKPKDQYDQAVKPVYLADLKTVSAHGSLIGYWNIDEPNLGNWRENLQIAEWYCRDIRLHDPYRPVFALYARHIPPVPAATDWFDVFGYDVYTYPDWDRAASDVVNSMAAETRELDARIRPLHKPIYIMPMPTALDLRRSPLGLSYEEQLAQCYTAIIHGAKGLLYFAQMYAWGQETWAAFRRLASDLKLLTPAVLSVPVPHEIVYEGKDVDIGKRKFPLVHAALFRYPDGDHVLLAVNSRRHDVTVRFSLPGLRNVSRTVATTPATLDIADSSFAEQLEGLAVRAYRLRLAAAAAASPVTVTVSENTETEAGREREPVRAALERVSRQKNLVMNPSFEWGAKLEGIPDYYHPYLPIYPERLGSAEHPCWRLDTADPYDGRHCLALSKPAAGSEWSNNALLGRFSCLGLDAAPRAYTLSFYLKGQKAGDTVRVWSVFARWEDGKFKREVVGKGYRLTTEWKRYSLPPMALARPEPENSPIPLTHGLFRIAPDAGARAWVDAIQFEQGEMPTEFVDPGAEPASTVGVDAGAPRHP